jgi:hypothetical protein
MFETLVNSMTERLEDCGIELPPLSRDEDRPETASASTPDELDDEDF